MINIGVGFSAEKEAPEAIKEAVRMAKKAVASETINLAIVFSSIELASDSLLRTLDNLLGAIPIIGSSGAAVITPQGILKNGLVIMLLSLPAHIYFNTASVTDIRAKTALAAGREMADKLLYGFKGIRRDVSIIFSDGLIDEGSSLIYGLQERLGRSFPLVGASASDNLSFSKTYLYSNEGIFNDGAIGILLGGKLNFGLGIKHGWKPLGKQRDITQAKGNILYEIDNKPAVNIYQEYLTYSIAELKKDIRRISILYPIGVYLEGEEEYLLRNVISVEDNGALRLQGNVTTGNTVRLMIGTKDSCFDATREATEEAKKGLFNLVSDTQKAGMNNFVLVFDSVSRYTLLRRDAEKEIEIIRAAFGQDMPVIGLYTYGEQAPLRAITYQGQAYFHNQTISILAIGG